MAQFKPIMVAKKENLDSISKIAGQYIVVLDASEVYIDKQIGTEVVREKASQNIYMQTESAIPENPKTGDIWFVIEEENAE